MGGPDINYPAQPSYGEGMAEALKAQANLLRGTGEDFADVGPLIDLIPLSTEAQVAATKGATEAQTAALLGDVTRADEAGRVYREELVGAGEDITDLEAAGYEVRTIQDTQNVNKIGLYRPGETEPLAVATGDSSATLEGLRADLLSQAQDLGLKTQGEMRTVQDPDLYTPGAIVSTSDAPGGMLGLLGGTTQVRKFDQQEYDKQIAAGKTPSEARAIAETYGDVGFTGTGEFEGMLRAQEQGQRFLKEQQVAGDLGLVGRYGQEATEAMRAQGNIGSALEAVGAAGQSNVMSDLVRNDLLMRARELPTQGLTARERGQIQQASRQAGEAAGRIRDIGRIQDEALAVAQEDRARQMQNIGMAQQILGQESGLQSQEQQRALATLGAEQATSADPMMAILGRPSTTAPGAGQMMQSGLALGQSASPQFLNPEAGLGYISNQATNQANLAAAQAGAKSSMMSGLFGGIGTALGGPIGGAIGGMLS